MTAAAAPLVAEAERQLADAQGARMEAVGAADVGGASAEPPALTVAAGRDAGFGQFADALPGDDLALAGTMAPNVFSGDFSDSSESLSLAAPLDPSALPSLSWQDAGRLTADQPVSAEAADQVFASTASEAA